jgi:surfeit locus 1 family protein
MTPRTRFWVVTVAALVAALVTARLGWWQLSRAAEKLALNAAIEKQADRPALQRAEDLPGETAAALAQHHRSVALRGRWSAAHTVYLDNRQMNGKPGFFVVTPLLLADGRAVLVQRGWQARDFLDRARVAAVPTPDGEVAVNGRLAPPPARLFEFDGDATGPIRQNLEVTAFAAETGLKLMPLSVLQRAPVEPADALLREWPSPLVGVDRHHGYAFQWFGLSALIVILYVWFQLIQPRRQRR